ncbi:translationally-controlled tumor protein homolog [Scophthalmus maximus]|uniref:Translationally-controlled tumor protein homolog n=2 Tax=Scophthalmus maximus TaxID=52904 RepID=TCTP_SCOMX|nr:translationally-controlled tumor protein homolog [Scophthalmus maximus]Q202I6.1 RecName: Full=Translationally-controlled tumor protein homolog; Short=TCTP [Scophthalmus maximus]ABD65408.1 translationally controlled tumor protein [Scophthalmus maximus]
MIIYKDLLSGDEMFSNIYKIRELEGGILLEVEGKRITRTEAIDDSAFGANPSAEELSEANEAAVSSGVDIILNHKLISTLYNKKQYSAYIKKYMKDLKTKLEETNPERVDAFVAGAVGAVKMILGKFKDFEFYTGESMNHDAMVGLLDYREDGITPIMLFFKDGLEIEKC